VGNRVPSYAEQLQWDHKERAFFRRLGNGLREILPPEGWRELGQDERQRRIEEAHRYLHREMGIKRLAPIIWTDDPDNEGAGYDQTSADGDIHYPRHHLATAAPEHLVRGLCEEMRHAWQDDVHRGLTRHPLGEVGERALEHGFATYDENNPLNDTTNRLELDAKERAEWCVDGYVGRESIDR
jgi:hypothetical protein